MTSVLISLSSIVQNLTNLGYGKDLEPMGSLYTPLMEHEVVNLKVDQGTFAVCHMID